MQNSRSRSGAGSGRRTRLISLGVIGLAGVGLIGLWWTASTRIPAMTVPMPVMPNPNAYNFYLAAGKAITGSKQIDDAGSSKPTVVYTLAQKENMLRQNAGVFKTARQGFAHPYLNPPTRTLGAFNTDYTTFRELTRVTAFQGKVRSEEGNWSGAADSCLDAMWIGQDIPHGSDIIGALTGIACQAIGRRPMWSIGPHLNAAQSHAAIKRLSTIIDRRLSYADTLQEEKWAQQSNLLAMFGDKKRVDPLAQTVLAANGPSDQVQATVSALYYLVYSKSRIMYGLTTYMDAIIAQARQPYAAKLPLPPLPSDPLNRIMLPVMMEARIKATNCETQNALLLVTLALHAFRLEHGHYPASLAELAPAYLKRLPEDPYALRGTFQYHLKGTDYVLYSVGPDGKDDGGTPIDDPKKATVPESNNRYFVDKDSLGDIVAGKNTW